MSKRKVMDLTRYLQHYPRLGEGNGRHQVWAAAILCLSQVQVCGMSHAASAISDHGQVEPS